MNDRASVQGKIPEAKNAGQLSAVATASETQKDAHLLSRVWLGVVFSQSAKAWGSMKAQCQTCSRIPQQGEAWSAAVALRLPEVRSRSRRGQLCESMLESQLVRNDRRLPGKPVACSYGLLWCIVACYFRLLGFPGIPQSSSTSKKSRPKLTLQDAGNIHVKGRPSGLAPTWKASSEPFGAFVC